MTDANISETLTGIGNGLGAFLSAVTMPLGNIVLILGIVGGVIAIFAGIAFAIKKSIHK